MNVKHYAGGAMINKDKYSDILIIDREGTVIHGDFANLKFLGLQPEEITGNNIRNLYHNIGENYPALIAARDGTAAENFQVSVENASGSVLTKTGSVYPIFDEDTPVAAIEFSDLHYDRDHIREIESHAEFPIYRKNDTKYMLENIITEDSSIENIKKRIERIAITESSILIYGETGTGKELVAQAIHNRSRRYYHKFISINCGAMPSGIIEGLLFGTTKGSFTGAEDKPGLFEQADGGTLFLDEINSLDPMLQVKLLKAVESRTVRRLGSPKEKQVDVRIIAATNEEPHELMSSGRLKPDLYYRLAVIYMYLPPLRERGNDVNVIADYYVDYFNKKMETHIEPLSDEIRKIFASYSWPGNVRELRNAIEGAFAFVENDCITVNELPQYIVDKYRSGEKNTVFRNAETLADLSSSTEYAIISEAYRRSSGSLTRAADMLGISKQLLKYKMTKYGR